MQISQQVFLGVLVSQTGPRWGQCYQPGDKEPCLDLVRRPDFLNQTIPFLGGRAVGRAGIHLRWVAEESECVLLTAGVHCASCWTLLLNHRIVWLEEAFKCYLVQPLCNEQEYLHTDQVLRDVSTLALSVSRNGLPSPPWATSSSISPPSL